MSKPFIHHQGAEDSWKRMLLAVPRQNQAAITQIRANSTLQIIVKRRRPKWLVPPLTWILRLAPVHTLQLDAIGTKIWQWCNGQHSVETIIELFARDHAFSFHEARSAVTGYLKLLVQRGALAIELNVTNTQ